MREDLTFSCPGIARVREPMNNGIRKQVRRDITVIAMQVLSEYYSPVCPPNLIEELRATVNWEVRK